MHTCACVLRNYKHIMRQNGVKYKVIYSTHEALQNMYYRDISCLDKLVKARNHSRRLQIPDII